MRYSTFVTRYVTVCNEVRNGMQRLLRPELAGGALFDVGIYPAHWISMILGAPSKVSGGVTAVTAVTALTAITAATYNSR